jgi:ATP-dependent Lon protease
MTPDFRFFPFLSLPIDSSNAPLDDDGELIAPDPDNGDDADRPDTLPLLPVRNTVLFPGVVLPVTVNRKKSIKLVRRAYRSSAKLVGVVAQQNPTSDDPSVADLFPVGTLARILKLLVLPDGNITIIIQGQSRFRVAEVTQETPWLAARVTYLPEFFPERPNKEVRALVSSLKDTAQKILKLNPEIPQEAQIALDNIDSPAFLTHFLSSNINAEVAQKQRLLEEDNGVTRGTMLLELLLKEVQMLEMKREIQHKAHIEIDQQQREYFLRQQIKTLQDELGFDGPEQEVERLRARGAIKPWPEAVAKHFNKELDKLGRLNPQSADFPITLNYAELLLDLPWGEYTKDNFNLKRTRKILDEDHYGLDKVKERLIEYLAVLKLKNDLRAPILCLYGPPGVGKTSLGRSVARSLGRKFARMSLGGVRDESEIRGHRKTYVGAMPGRLISILKKVGSSNPVILLDEIDKVGNDFRGDPQAALLEVLDPEQNSTFTDNYLEVEYDLSKVLFIATANSLDTIHPALRDRMEIIDLTGYTLEEKTQIARRHLVPKQVAENGLLPEDVSVPLPTLHKLIDGYTRESGVRGLERQIAKLLRSVARAKATDGKAFTPRAIQPSEVVGIMGPERFDRDQYQDNDTAGVVTGLAWTSVGGDILFIETLLSRGRGKLTLSGQLGDVMKESAMTALSYLRSRADDLGIDYRLFDHYDLHIHFPEGAVPKDGPSAGIAIFTAIASVFTQRKVRAKLAMTGEITLRGKVLPVGGIKEKLLAARRAGIEVILLSEKNRKDVTEIPAEYLKGVTIEYVNSVDDVVACALLPEQVSRPLRLTVPDKPLVVGAEGA